MEIFNKNITGKKQKPSEWVDLDSQEPLIGSQPTVSFRLDAHETIG